jgi:flavorubredoxin
MDHSGCLPAAIEQIHPEKVFASRMGLKALGEHFHADWDLTEVTSGDEISLGRRTLTFLETRLLHWPDSMFTYLPEDGVLFSQDGFGMHLASNERFADELPEPVLDWEAAKYYANIVLPFSPVVERTLAKVQELGLSPQVIAPDHGPVYRRDLDWIISRYVRWAAQAWSKKAVIVYDTMWGSTAKMAQAISSGVAEAGVTARVLPLGASHRSDVATELLDAGALIVGSPTINGSLFPTVADIMTYLQGLKRKNLLGAVFGSYGWSGEATRHIVEYLERMKVELVGEAVRTTYVPNEDVLSECYALGQQVAGELRKRCEK